MKLPVAGVVTGELAPFGHGKPFCIERGAGVLNGESGGVMVRMAAFERMRVDDGRLKRAKAGSDFRNQSWQVSRRFPIRHRQHFELRPAKAEYAHGRIQFGLSARCIFFASSGAGLPPKPGFKRASIRRVEDVAQGGVSNQFVGAAEGFVVRVGHHDQGLVLRA